jgi:antirestriction protein ArdC
VTGKGYSAMNALILGMQRHDDPRWLSFDAARFAGTPVKKDSNGTMIEFSKRNEIQKIRTPDGKPVKDDAGVTQTKTVTFDKPQQARSFLFNASQMTDVEPLADFLARIDQSNDMTPVEKAAKLIADSGATVIEGGKEAYYDKQRDAIFIPEKTEFANETKYYQAAIHQLAHWTGHESRLNRDMTGKMGSLDYAHEELRATIAAILIGGEIKLGHDFGQHKAYMGPFQRILKDDPFEIAKASRDAQKITDMVMGRDRDRSQQQGAAKTVAFEKGDQIAYMDTTYTVLDIHKNKNIKVENTDGAKRTVKPSDVLYSSLLEAKINPRGPVAEVGNGVEQEQTYKMSR